MKAIYTTRIGGMLALAILPCLIVSQAKADVTSSVTLTDSYSFVFTNNSSSGPASLTVTLGGDYQLDASPTSAASANLSITFGVSSGPTLLTYSQDTTSSPGSGSIPSTQFQLMVPASSTLTLIGTTNSMATASDGGVAGFDEGYSAGLTEFDVLNSSSSPGSVGISESVSAQLALSVSGGTGSPFTYASYYYQSYPNESITSGTFDMSYPQSSTYSIDPGSSEFGYDEFALDAVVPEPSTMTLYGLGIIAVLMVSRSRLHSTSHAAVPS